LGLLVLEADTDPIHDGDNLHVDQSNLIHNLTKRREIQTRLFPPLIKEILEAGGIIPYMEQKFAKVSP
jgi:3-isopropylmalate/(R)-2-methylmalate dehydratase small subunit